MACIDLRFAEKKRKVADEQLELARHFGPLHKHATTPVPREPGLEEVHGKLPECSIAAAVTVAEGADKTSPPSCLQRRLAPA